MKSSSKSTKLIDFKSLKDQCWQSLLWTYSILCSTLYFSIIYKILTFLIPINIYYCLGLFLSFLSVCFDYGFVITRVYLHLLHWSLETFCLYFFHDSHQNEHCSSNQSDDPDRREYIEPKMRML